jgi:hypothetical protein
MIFDFCKTRSNTKRNFAEKYNNKVVFVLVCLENNFIGCTVTSQVCLKIRFDESKTSNQYTSNFVDDFRLSEQRLMSCVETLRATPKL